MASENPHLTVIPGGGKPDPGARIMPPSQLRMLAPVLLGLLETRDPGTDQYLGDLRTSILQWVRSALVALPPDTPTLRVLPHDDASDPADVD